MSPAVPSIPGSTEMLGLRADGLPRFADGIREFRGGDCWCHRQHELESESESTRTRKGLSTRKIGRGHDGMSGRQ